jgi:hypothetical protein
MPKDYLIHFCAGRMVLVCSTHSNSWEQEKELRERDENCCQRTTEEQNLIFDVGWMRAARESCRGMNSCEVDESLNPS